MEKIASFRIDHLRLEPGIYVSRKDVFGGVTLTTFDIRLTAPNREPVLNTAELHTIEHLGATFLRNRDGVKERVVYFGPMGCRTGFYAILEGDLTSEELVPLMREMFAFIRDFEGVIPGAKPDECGNYAD
ncbi:MAG: S-ribosylhomocysteine lyase, partial [Lachnospiraceae bacterium]|nr:S-ribosylhomocysteine lyase [Lachnospiraceae bacterium]